ncbi:MAG: hypothetical protein AAGF47_04055 [Planctomycetota bacterium]
MISIHDGQCGKCAHFGDDSGDERLVQVRVRGQAPEDLVESCGHPTLSAAELRVAANSTCSNYTPHAKSA